MLSLALAYDAPWRKAAIVVAGELMVLCTRGWHAIRNGKTPGTKLELYAKPDDRWEVNEVADRCAEIAAAAAEVLASVDREGDASDMESIDELLAGED